MSVDPQTAEREKIYSAERVHKLEAEKAAIEQTLKVVEAERNAWAQRVLEAERARDGAQQSQDTFIGLHQALTYAIAELFPSTDEWLAFTSKVEVQYWASVDASKTGVAANTVNTTIASSDAHEFDESAEGEP